MSLLQQLQSLPGRLIRIKTPLFWYGEPGLDNTLGRVCLVLDTRFQNWTGIHIVASTPWGRFASSHSLSSFVAHLMIDGSPQWILVDERDIELINDPA